MLSSDQKIKQLIFLLESALFYTDSSKCYTFFLKKILSFYFLTNILMSVPITTNWENHKYDIGFLKRTNKYNNFFFSNVHIKRFPLTLVFFPF